MNSQVTFHPDEALLEGYVQGTLSVGMNVVISAHVELCADCQQRSQDMESSASQHWMQAEAPQKPAMSADVTAIIKRITAQPQVQELPERASAVEEIHMLDHSVRLPRVLAKVASEGLVWKKLSSGINQASVTLDDKTQCDFLYMKPGSQVPVHKHQGNEITLVLDGSFSDESGMYRQSDFVVRTPAHIHQPVSEEGCLCFAVLDSPLTFTSGLARLLNPFLRYRFRRATSIGV
jgi:putative transcriptional regulator